MTDQSPEQQNPGDNPPTPQGYGGPAAPSAHDYGQPAQGSEQPGPYGPPSSFPQPDGSGQGWYPAQPGRPGQPGQSGHPGQPGQPGQPGFSPQQGGPGYPPQPGYPGYAAPQPSPLGGLVDLGFTRRITPALAKIVHMAVIVLAVIITLLGILAAIGMFATAGDRFIGGGVWVFYGIVTLVLSPVFGFLTVAFGRFWLELFLDSAAANRGARER